MNRSDIPHDPRLRWEWIKYQLRAKGTSLATLARDLRVTAQAVKNVKRSPYPRMERAIAKALGIAPQKLWPERWNSDGTPQRKRPRRAESTLQYPCIAIGESSRCVHVPHRKTGTEG